jgi:hypothetical protein
MHFWWAFAERILAIRKLGVKRRGVNHTAQTIHLEIAKSLPARPSLDSKWDGGGFAARFYHRHQGMAVRGRLSPGSLPRQELAIK